MASSRYEAGYQAPHTVLVIGVADYEGALPALLGVTADIRNIQSAFETLNQTVASDLTTPGYDIIPVLNKDATGDGIRAALRSFQGGDSTYHDKTASNRAVIIYLAGHGVVRQTRDGVATAYFVPFDYDPERKNWDSLIPFDTILNARHFMASKHILFIFNCCYSGMALLHNPLTLHAEPIQWIRSADQELKSTVLPSSDAAWERSTRYRAYQVITAGNFDENVPDAWTTDLRQQNVVVPKAWLIQSPFNVALCAGLDGAAADDFGYCTADRLAYYVRQRLLTEQHYRDTLPRFGYLVGHEGGDLVLGQPNRVGTPPAPQYPVITRRKGLISLISPSSATAREMIGRDKTQWDGIEYHRLSQKNDTSQQQEDEFLTHLWLICTDESSVVAERMLFYFTNEFPSSQLKIRLCVVSDPYSVTEMQILISTILTDSLAAAQLTPDQVVLDVTGGTTPMTIGAALAAQKTQPPVALQYCSINHLSYSGGKPNTSRHTESPIRLLTVQDNDGISSPIITP